MFGVVGIAGEAGQLGSSYVDVMVGGSYRAGETTWYDFHFKTGVLLDAGSWMRFTFPSNNFGLTTRPSCYSKSLFGVLVKGNLTCTNNDGVV